MDTNVSLEELSELSTKLAEELDSYNSKKSKATSKRIRLLLGDLKKKTADFRKMLVEMDRTN